MSGFDSATIFWRVLGPDQLTSAAVSWKATADPVDWMTILLPRHLVHGPWHHTYMCHTYWPCPLMAKKATIWAEQLALEHVAEGDLMDGYTLKNNLLIFHFSIQSPQLTSIFPYFLFRDKTFSRSRSFPFRLQRLCCVHNAYFANSGLWLVHQVWYNKGTKTEIKIVNQFSAETVLWLQLEWGVWDIHMVPLLLIWLTPRFACCANYDTYNTYDAENTYKT